MIVVVAVGVVVVVAVVHPVGRLAARQVWQFLELHPKILCGSLGTFW